MTAPTLPRRAAAQLAQAHERIETSRALVGLDGFVDTILHVVDKRESASKFTRLDSMGEFARRIEAAAGLSANFEFVTQMIKLGGNGPIMADALVSSGLKVIYVGCLGAPNLHPVFADLATRATVHSIAEPGYTDAIEFDDGKLMCGKHDSLKEVNWPNLINHLPEAKLLEAFSNASLIALVNWTMLPLMTGILQNLVTRIAPRLKDEKRWLFFDLADPAKRTREHIATLLKTITRFQKFFKVIVGLNWQEARRVGEVLGMPLPAETYGTVTDHAARILAKLKIDTVVVHPTSFAAAADATGSAHVIGPFVAKPKLTTGAGDHFNSGFCIGRLIHADLATSLQLGVATSGYYVRHAKSPSLDDLEKFLRTL
jgi:hypothetical protein